MAGVHFAGSGSSGASVPCDSQIRRYRASAENRLILCYWEGCAWRQAGRRGRRSVVGGKGSEDLAVIFGVRGLWL